MRFQNRRRCHIAFAAASSVVAILQPRSVLSATLYDASTGLGKIPTYGIADFAQQITLNGPNQPYTLSSFSTLGTNWTNVSNGSQYMLLYFFTGANLSSGSTNVLDSATLDTLAGIYALSPPSTDSQKTYSFTLPTGTVVPSNTFTVEALFASNTAFTNFSTSVSALETSGSPAVGANPGFSWVDSNQDGILSGSEQIADNIDFAVNATAASSTFQWNTVSGGKWEAYTSWAPHSVPSTAVNVVFNLFSNSVTAPGYGVSLSSAIDSCNTLTVESDRVTLDIAAANPSSGSNSGSLSIGGALTVGKPAGGTTGPINGFLTISQSGAGQNVNVTAGSVIIGSVGGVGILSVSSGVTLTSGTGVTVGSGSTLIIAPGGRLVTPTLTLSGSAGAWTGLFDITSGAIDLSGGDLATVTDQVRQGYNFGLGGTWNSLAGITSSTAASDTGHLTAVGVIQNNQGGPPLYGTGAEDSNFQGFSPGATDVLVKYTYFGDANLDGVVDGSDYSLIDAGYESNQAGFAGSSLTGWYNGDFNYDGTIDGSDYALIDNSFNNQGGGANANLVHVSASIAWLTTVPEPEVFISIAATVGTGMTFRRRRRKYQATQFL